VAILTTASNGAIMLGHDDEPHDGSATARLNWLRASVLGANDGIVSTAGLVVGVAGLVAGSLSMAGGEYVSVSTQRDSERALLEQERLELAEMPEVELEELVQIYEGKGLTRSLAEQVGEQLTSHDALAAHAEAELGIDPEALVSPMAAALASMVSFALGALLPLLAIVLPPASARVPVTVAAVTAALIATGWGAARIGQAPARPSIVRNVAVGLLAMGLTFVVGSIVGAVRGA
jgi:VIT1/CCC1 family predicted Fe2+/Mn2+ transporter